MLWHWTRPRGIGWLPHLTTQNCLGDPRTELFEKGTNHLRCPTVSCLFSVPCPGWSVKHVFRLIGSHIHLDPRPRLGSASPILGKCPCGGLSGAARSQTPSQSDSFLMCCTCCISNSFCFELQNCWTHFMFGEIIFLGTNVHGCIMGPKGWLINICLLPQQGVQL